jgi:glycine cleavage system H lipoate-binding protein
VSADDEHGEGAPDFVQAVVGYRAWHLEDDGTLRPWTFSALPWDPGVNQAVCARDVRHAAPVEDCMCGLYALTDPADRRLDFRADQAVGAIAAWGDMEVHRTGFRASHACVTALALPDGAGYEMREALARAARRYGVPLVAADALSDEALKHGAPLPEEMFPAAPPPASWPGRRRDAAQRFARPTVPAVDPAGFGAAARGIALDAHLWVETALGAVVVGLTHALAAGLGEAPKVTLPEPGAALEAGDLVATVRVGDGGGGTFGIWAPVGGAVLAVNPKLAEDPALLARDPEGAGWLLRLAPRDWSGEAGAVTWGAAAPRHYAAMLERDATARGDAFADVRLERLRALPPVRSAADVLALLRAEREAPRFADAAAVHEQLGGRIRDALDATPDVRERLDRIGARVRFILREPDAELTIDCGGADVVELSCTAEDAYRWFIGKLDPSAALRGGDLTSSADRVTTLRALALLKYLRIEAWEPGPSWARPSAAGSPPAPRTPPHPA